MQRMEWVRQSPSNDDPNSVYQTVSKAPNSVELCRHTYMKRESIDSLGQYLSYVPNDLLCHTFPTVISAWKTVLSGC